MSNKKKSIAAIIAVIALVSILAVCLCACGKKTTELPQTPEEFKEKLESKGYDFIEIIDETGDELDGMRAGIVEEYLNWALEHIDPNLPLTAADAQYLEWYMYACKNESGVVVEIYKFANEEAAKKWYQCFLLLAQDDDPEYYGAEIRGTMVFFQTLEGIRDALN